MTLTRADGRPSDQTSQERRLDATASEAYWSSLLPGFVNPPGRGLSRNEHVVCSCRAEKASIYRGGPCEQNSSSCAWCMPHGATHDLPDPGSVRRSPDPKGAKGSCSTV